MAHTYTIELINGFVGNGEIDNLKIKDGKYSIYLHGLLDKIYNSAEVLSFETQNNHNIFYKLIMKLVKWVKQKFNLT